MATVRDQRLTSVGEGVETGEDSSDTVAVGDTEIGLQGIQQRIATRSSKPPCGDRLKQSASKDLKTLCTHTVTAALFPKAECESNRTVHQLMNRKPKCALSMQWNSIQS